MLAVVGWWEWCDIGLLRSGISVDWNAFWAERWETCFLLECVLPCFVLVVVTLGTGGRDLLVAEESECDSSPVSEGRGEAGIFCAGEDMPVS
jgi:hypothetical protein